MPDAAAHLLADGSFGIAVGMAQIPPQPTELIPGLLGPDRRPGDRQTRAFDGDHPGPDFPTGGSILGRRGASSRTRTPPAVARSDAGGGFERNPRSGLGRPDRDAVIITEVLPYQTNKASLDRAHRRNGRNDKRLEGISRHSATKATRRRHAEIVIELRRGRLYPRLCSTTVQSSPPCRGQLQRPHCWRWFQQRAQFLSPCGARLQVVSRLPGRKRIERRTRYCYAKAEERTTSCWVCCGT